MARDFGKLSNEDHIRPPLKVHRTAKKEKKKRKEEVLMDMIYSSSAVLWQKAEKESS